jgi:PPOX class probable F420-dependent enzyme
MLRGVNDAEMRIAVEAARVGRLATVSEQGRPHVVPICFALHGDVVYSAVDHKAKRTTRLRRIVNIEATGSACLLVDYYDEDWSTLWWVRLDGIGRVVTGHAEAERAINNLVDKYPQYRERQPHGPVLALDISHWTGWSAALS